MSFREYTPAVSRRVRMLTAGTVWSGVGVMLCAWAAIWLLELHDPVAALIAIAGATMALALWRLAFSRIVGINVERIGAAPERACFFSFQATKSYLFMFGMIAFGFALRHSALPKLWLALLYTGIGGALFLSSLSYYRAREPELKRL